jgi:GDP-4-dehydro-6-deoxy-D-mannose reductase
VKKALVTGACGFVGPYLIKELLTHGYDVTATYVIEPKVRVQNTRYEKLDILNFAECSRVLSDVKPEVIFHLAGIAFVPEAESSFERTLQINVAGVNNIIRIPFLLDYPTTFVCISSAEVYGKIDTTDLPLNEKHIPKPQSNYSLSKLFAEQLVHKYAVRSNLITPIIARPFNHIGAGQDPRFVASSFAKQLADIKNRKAEPRIKVGNLEAERDFSDVKDIVRGYRLAAEKGSGTYNFCSGRPLKIKTILEKLITISGLSVVIEEDPERMRPAETPTIYGSFEKANKELGWQPSIEIDHTLSDLYHGWL